MIQWLGSPQDWGVQIHRGQSTQLWLVLRELSLGRGRSESPEAFGPRAPKKRQIVPEIRIFQALI